jgi:hypothetical protein
VQIGSLFDLSGLRLLNSYGKDVVVGRHPPPFATT